MESKFEEYEDATVEYIITGRQKGKKYVWRKVNGRIDNKKYAEVHRENFLQPTGRDKAEFIRTFGTEAYENCINIGKKKWCYYQN